MDLPLDGHAREAVLIGFDPGGHEAGNAVFPAPEPQEHDVQVVLPGARQQSVDERKIVFAFHGLDPVPRHGHQDGVEVHPHQPRPDWLHVVEAGGSGVGGFPRQGEIRLAVHDQLGRHAPFFEMGNGRGGLPLKAGGHQGKRADRKATGHGCWFHMYIFLEECMEEIGTGGVSRWRSAPAHIIAWQPHQGALRQPR